MAKNQTNYQNLETINEDGSIPASRLNDAFAVHQIVDQMMRDNEKRNKVDSQLYGLFSGNPPYRQSSLNSQAQGWRCNVNWRIAEAFLNVALTSYWDVISEAPTYCRVETTHGESEDQRSEWSGIITEEFQKLNKSNPSSGQQSLNYMFRVSHHDMVLFRCGPVMFEDTLNFRSRAIKQHKLLVPDRSESSVNQWPLAVVLVDYKVDELYSYIRNPKEAAKIGYNIKAVRHALINAYRNYSGWPNGQRYDWMWLEERIRNNDLYWSNIGEAIPVAHVFWREFPREGEVVGKISHAMVLQDDLSTEFLFRHTHRFDHWQQIIHPFYFDTGDGSHHSVKGMGIKAFGALESYNRMHCHAVDAALWSSSSHWQAADAAAMQNLAVVPMGPWIIHPPGINFIQMQLGHQLDGLVAIKQDTLQTVASNLSTYRQDVRRKSGNPPTARQISYESENESVIGKSGMTWYFEQLDDFYTERYRRASNPNLLTVNPGGTEALAFQKACKDRGVKPEALLKVNVTATRTIGYGSADSRMQALMRMLARIGMYNEKGRLRILEDITAADVGHSTMRRYIEKENVSELPGPQHSEAMDKVVGMKIGVKPMVTPDQNPVIYAEVYLNAGSQSVGGLEQGANPMEVYQFLEVCGPAIYEQLQRIEQDPTRKAVYDALLEQWQRLAKVHDQLKGKIQQQMKAQQAQAQKQKQLQSADWESRAEMAIKDRESQQKAALKGRNQFTTEGIKRQKHAQDMALKDAETAAKIRREEALAKAEVKRRNYAAFSSGGEE